MVVKMARGILRAGWRQRRRGAGLVPYDGSRRFKGMTGSTRLGKLYLQLKPLLSASKTQLTTKY